MEIFQGTSFYAEVSPAKRIEAVPPDVTNAISVEVNLDSATGLAEGAGAIDYALHELCFIRTPWLGVQPPS